jgi:predicted dinucleotide-binding enzyme
MSAAPSIAIVGGGGVGRALGTNLLVRNRSVCFGSRDPAKLQQALAADPQLAGVAVLPVAEAVAKSEVVIVAVPGELAAASDGRTDGRRSAAW